MNKLILALISIGLFTVSCTKQPNKAENVPQAQPEIPKEVISKSQLRSFEDDKSGLYGYKNEKGDIVIPARFSIASDPAADEELLAVVLNDKFVRADKLGNPKFESFVYDNAWDDYQQDLARFVLDKKIGFHNKKGEVVIAAKYDFATPFNNGNAVVCNGCSSVSDGEHFIMQGGKWGAINLTGTETIAIEEASQEAVQEKLKQKKS